MTSWFQRQTPSKFLQMSNVHHVTSSVLPSTPLVLFHCVCCPLPSEQEFARTGPPLTRTYSCHGA